MRAIRLERLGETPVLGEVAPPVPGRGEVLVRIRACGLNFADLLMVDGRYQERQPLPFTMGMEVAGVVEALGPGTDGPAPGTRVAVMAGHGGLAEAGVFEASRLLPIPDAMSFEEAAAFQIAYGTSHLALSHRARLQPGETLFVTGAAGGVGLTAVEIGRLMGARVIASARGEDKLAVAEAAGAQVLIDSSAPDLRERLKAEGGVDVFYDAVGGAAFGEVLRAMRPEGRMLVIGFAGGDVPPIPANILLVKNVSVLGFYWGGYQTFAPCVLRDSLATLLGWYEAGGIHPHVSHVLPLDEALAGFELLRSRKATGKVVVRI